MLDLPLKRYRRPLQIRHFIYMRNTTLIPTNAKSKLIFNEMDKKDLPVMYSVCSLFHWIFNLRIQPSVLASRR